MVQESDCNKLSFVCTPCHLNSLPFPNGSTNEIIPPFPNVPNDSPDLPDISSDIGKMRGLKIGH